MKHLSIKDLSTNEELDHEAMADVCGGVWKRPWQRARVEDLLTTPDGDPIDVYVDGVKVNSVVDGFYHL